MGSSRWKPEDWTDYKTTHIDKKTTDEIYSASSIDPTFDPKKITVRESRDSALNPNSNAIILAQDVTGSMEPVLDSMIREGLPKCFTELYDHKPVSDPHILIMGIGDVECDRSPVQATQFEADVKLADQLKTIFLEGGGGGNSYESYAAAWYFAAQRTSIDCFEKRGKKGYLFTIGDEGPTPYLTRAALKQFFGDDPQEDLSVHQLLDMATRQWEVFHVMVAEGNHMRGHSKQVTSAWRELLGQRAILLTDKNKLAEVVTAAIRVCEGEDHAKVVGSFKDKSTALVVKSAVGSLTKTGGSDSVVTL